MIGFHLPLQNVHITTKVCESEFLSVEYTTIMLTVHNNIRYMNNV